MPIVLAHRDPPTIAASDLEFAVGLVEWLDDLLEAASDRADLSLARLIAGLMDDLRPPPAAD